MLSMGARVAMSPPPSPSHRSPRAGAKYTLPSADGSSERPTSQDDFNEPGQPSKLISRLEAIVTLIGQGAHPTLSRQSVVILYGIGSIALYLYALGRGVDPSLSRSPLGCWRPLLHVALSLAAGVWDFYAFGRHHRKPGTGKFSYWSTDPYCLHPRRRLILTRALTDAAKGVLFMVGTVWPLMFVVAVVPYARELGKGGEASTEADDALLYPAVLMAWLWGALWLGSGTMIYEYIQPSIKGLREDVFERLRKGELGAERFLEEHSSYMFLAEEWVGLVGDCEVTNVFMMSSVFVAIYDWIFSPWSSGWHLLWVVGFTLPIAFGLSSFVENEREEREMIAWISQGRDGTQGWSLQDRANVVVLLRNEIKVVKMLGQVIDEDTRSKYLFFVASLSVFMYTFGADTDWEGFPFDKFGENATAGIIARS